ncbi:MAG TPA: response regulator [Phycisphaerae bacterium]|nr:response regulator [Phycisphaerae bacterium]HQL53980.1 response regulator [Phycisphaerae bacterium]
MMRMIPVRALVIDDEEAVCRRVGAWLREAACDVVTFTDPRDGLAHAGRAPCHVALVDLRLAGVDGLEVLASLRQVAPDTRLIAIAAFPEVGQVIAAMRAGARDLLEKPVRQATLLEAVERQLLEIGVGIRSEQAFNQRLGARLRAVRTAAERTLADVANDCGLTVAQLSQIELGKSATSTWTLARIASALKTPLERLLNTL